MPGIPFSSSRDGRDLPRFDRQLRTSLRATPAFTLTSAPPLVPAWWRKGKKKDVRRKGGRARGESAMKKGQEEA